MSARGRARLRAWLGLDTWFDLSVHHPLFRTPQYAALREVARVFDVPRPHKPVVERPHQMSYLVARWLASAGVTSAFHVGYASGRHLFYLARLGVTGGGTDLPAAETAWTASAAQRLDATTAARLLTIDFFDLRVADISAAYHGVRLPIDVCFSEATFETLLPWRQDQTTVPKYRGNDGESLRARLVERLPATLAELAPCFRSFAFIEPEPAAGGAGAVFAACARVLVGYEYSVWMFRPPFDQLFRLTPRSPVRQAVYVYARDAGLTRALAPYAERAGATV